MDEAFFEDWMGGANEAACELQRYPGVGHYFLDRTLPDYDADAAELALGRSRDFLGKVESSLWGKCEERLQRSASSPFATSSTNVRKSNTGSNYAASQ